MGIFAQTNGEIVCKTKAKTKIVFDTLKALEKKSIKDHDLNFNFGSLELDEKYKTVYFDLSSGRIQNLEWQCEQIWEAIKDLGATELNCPFMSEADGIYRSLDSADCAT
jgi:hypothetical protein